MINAILSDAWVAFEADFLTSGHACCLKVSRVRKVSSSVSGTQHEFSWIFSPFILFSVNLEMAKNELLVRKEINLPTYYSCVYLRIFPKNPVVAFLIFSFKKM